MEVQGENRSARKRRAIMEAATEVFLERGYLGASMDEVAARASVSKQTVYKHFIDKERLFSEIVMATLDEVDEVMRLMSDIPSDGGDLEKSLSELARTFLVSLMQPRLLQLRRLIIANADRFPSLGATWYAKGFESVLETLAGSFRRLADDGLLEMDDAHLAAEHFAGLLLWIPLNEAMFSGDTKVQDEAGLHHYADAAVRAFLAAYHSSTTAVAG